MSNIEARIALQRNRFSLIEQAAEFKEPGNSNMNRQLVITCLYMLEQNWMKFQEEHENLCISKSDALSEQPYIKERIFERCQAFYVYSRAKLTQRDEHDTLNRHSRSSITDHGASISLMPRSTLPRIKLRIFSGDYQS